MLNGFYDDPLATLSSHNGHNFSFDRWRNRLGMTKWLFCVTHRKARLDPRLITNPQLFPPNVPNETKIFLYISFRNLNNKVCLQNLKYFPTNFFFPFPSGSPTSPPVQASLPSSEWSLSEEGGRDPSSNSLARHLGKLLSPSVLSFSTIKWE